MPPWCISEHKGGITYVQLTHNCLHKLFMTKTYVQLTHNFLHKLFMTTKLCPPLLAVKCTLSVSSTNFQCALQPPIYIFGIPIDGAVIPRYSTYIDDVLVA